MSCYDDAVKEIRVNGGKLMSGCAVAPNGIRYAHCWVERDGIIIDSWKWEFHSGWNGSPAVELHLTKGKKWML